MYTVVYAGIFFKGDVLQLDVCGGGGGLHSSNNFFFLHTPG